MAHINMTFSVVMLKDPFKVDALISRSRVVTGVYFASLHASSMLIVNLPTNETYFPTELFY